MNVMQLWCISFPFTLVVATADAGSCTDQSSLIQQKKPWQEESDNASEPSIAGEAPLLPFNNHLQAERFLAMPTRRARDWPSARDLATLGPVQKFTWTPEENHTYQLLFFSAVPSFGRDGNFIALLHDLWADSNPDDFLLGLKKFPLFCSGPGGHHKSKLETYGWDHGQKGAQVSVNFLCRWPKNESHLERYEIFLEDAAGKAIGSLVAKHKPQLFQKEYGTVACVREIFLTNQSNAPLKLLPEWMEFHTMHGIEHFFVYTFDDSDPGMEAILTPYINSGLATRIHFKQYPERHVRHHRLMTDCLFRAKSRAKWLLPTVDTDEYLHVSPKIFKGHVPKDYLSSAWDGILDKYKAKRYEVHSIHFELYRFARSSRNQVEISSTLREPTNNKNNEGRTKYVVNVKKVHGIWIHNPTNWEEGTYAIYAPRTLLCGNHYRYEDHIEYGEKDPTAKIHDHSLTREVPALKEALEKRFGLDSEELLMKLSYITPMTDMQIRAERSKGPNPLDPLDDATFQQDENRKQAAVAEGSDNTGGAALHKAVTSKLARLINDYKSRSSPFRQLLGLMEHKGRV